MINIEATIRWKGYNPRDLKPKSDKRVWTNCNSCGKGRWTKKSDSERLCGSCSKTGEKHHLYGKHHTKEAKQKISKANIGDKNYFYNKKFLGKNHPNWNGGRKLSVLRKNAKRKQFDFNPINSPQDNFEGHHLNLNDVLFIPKELHKSIAHSVTQNRHMNEINNLAEEWYLNDQGVIL